MSHDHNPLNQHPNIDGLTLFTAEPDPHEHKVHEHDAYSIIGLTHGAKQFHHKGNTVIVNAYEIAIANPGELHGCGPIDNAPWAHRTWYLSDSLMKEIANGLGIDRAVHLQAPVITDREIAEKLIIAHTMCHEEHDLLESQSLAIDALSNLVEQFSQERPDKTTIVKGQAAERVEVYENWLRSRFDQPVELSQLAAQVGVKRNQVIKDFKAAKGVTPGNYFRLMRLKHAKQAIRDGAELSQASNDFGFSDQSHFTRQFKAAFGVTPNRFKQLAQKSSNSAPL